MAKITLDTALTDYGAAKLNANFQKIANEFNNKVLYRDNPVGEPNTPTGDYDYNGKNFFNVNEARVTSLLINGENVLTAVGDIAASKNTAAASAASSQASANASAASAASAAGFSSQAGVYAGQAASAVSNTRNVADYAALRAYVANDTTIINITGYLISTAPSGIAGVFVRDDNDTTSEDNGGTIIVANNNKRWKRAYSNGVYAEWFGGAGDWNGASGTDNNAAITAALAASNVLRIGKGRYRCSSTVTVPANKTIINDGGEIVFTTGGLWLNAGVVCHNVFVSGNGKTNAGSGFRVLAGADGVRLFNPKVRDIHYNGIENANAALDLRIVNPDISNIGGAGINVTYQGCGYYGGAGGLLISGGNIDNTYGQAGVFVNGGDGWTVRGVNIHDTFYRGIQAYNNPTGGLISGNQIRRTGAINNTGSGVGCNGIFVPVASYTDLLIIGNEIEDVAENGIEGSGTYLNNTVNRTGYRNLTTPSKEGIFLSKSTVCKGNVITAAAGAGIKSFNTLAGATADVQDNTIYNPASTGISLQVDGASATYASITVAGNTVYGANDAAQAGINVIPSNSGTFVSTASAVRNNTVYGRTTNTTSVQIGIRTGNSYDPFIAYFGDVTGFASKGPRFTMVFNTPLTEGRAAFASTDSPQAGDVLRVVRTAACTGAFSINVAAPSTLKSLTAAGQWAEATYDGSAWQLTAFGSL